jgi:hypothetical protein
MEITTAIYTEMLKNNNIPSLGEHQNQLRAPTKSVISQIYMESHLMQTYLTFM